MSSPENFPEEATMAAIDLTLNDNLPNNSQSMELSWQPGEVTQQWMSDGSISGAKVIMLMMHLFQKTFVQLHVLPFLIIWYDQSG